MRAAVPLPFASLSARARRRVLLVFVAVGFTMLVVLASLDAGLRTSASPNGIVSFELAGSREAARRMLEAWGSEARRTAALILRLDFLFLAAYAPGLALLCAAAAENARSAGSRLATPAAFVAWGQLAAGGLDALENLALLRVLENEAASSGWPALAAACAWPKFALVAAGLIQLVALPLATLAARRRR